MKDASVTGSPSAVSTLPAWLQRHLARTLASGQGHAWLVAGATGLGQFEWAHAAAQAWLCESHDGRAPACGQCASCHLVSARTHPDLLMLVPDAWALARGWLTEEEEQGGGRSRSKPSQDIRVEALRRAVSFAQTSSARGRGKVVLLFPAERMNHVSANTLLKTLEEPPGSARFLLASEAPDRLLPTVRSRCQRVTMPWPAADEARPWLQAQGLEHADTWLRLAGGRPYTALAQARQGQDVALWRRLPAAVARGESVALQALGPATLVVALQKLCSDLMRLRCGAPPLHFEASDLPAPPSLASLSDWSRALVEHARHAEHPWQAPLMVETLVQQACGVLTIPHSSRSRRPD